MLEHLDDGLDGRLPIIWLWDCMLVPLQGELSDAQAARLTHDVLEGIRMRGCDGLIIEVSGLWLVDSHLCASLADIAHAARLMGTRTLLSGLRPEVALTLLAMDISFRGFETALNLEQALETLGIRRAADTFDPLATHPSDLDD
ncbi:MAG: STAS domain-containing protein [Myxococcota bacterium]